MAKQVAIHDLKPGMFIVGVIEQNGPVKIRKSGLVTSHEMVQGLSEMGVLSLAIDPEKTVEIELDDTVHVSQTQFVMQANEEKAAQDTDTHLSEQFNRSLFMPSLQKVPSAWQYYGVKIATACVVIVLGFTTGWYASNVPSMLAGDGTNQQIAEQTAEQTTVAESNEVAKQENAVANAVTPEVSDAELSAAISGVDVNPENQSSVPPVASESESQSAINYDNNSQIAANSSDTKDREVVGQSSQENLENLENLENQVSPELLQRFEQAMADLERESSPDSGEAEFSDDGETLEYGNVDNNFNATDVQRVDQLPARVMTRLPRMSFSAHMYASSPRDRWVKVNGVEKGEGEWLDEKVFIEKIEPQHVILLFEGHQFSMRALSEW